MNEFCTNDIYNTSKAYFFNTGDIETMNETVTVRFLKSCSFDLLKVLSDRKQNSGARKSNSANDQDRGMPKYLNILAKSIEETEKQIEQQEQEQSSTVAAEGESTIGSISLNPNSLSLSSLNLTQICSRDSTLKPGYTTEIPLRIAQLLREKKIVEIDYNKAYKKQSREILQAGACTVKLNQIQNHFYELGYYLLPDNDEIILAENAHLYFASI